MEKIKIQLNKRPLAFIGLGNIGTKYENTRHNAGFIFIDQFIKFLNNKGFQLETKEEKKYTLVKCKELNLYLLKPKTYMNLSGEALRDFLKYTNEIALDNLIIVHDDLDIALNKFKISFSKGPKLHNGILSIENFLNSNDFLRIRIGIENRDSTSQIKGIDYVLYNFSKEEREILKNCIKRIINNRIEL